ncbi:MAG: SIS domain-containing protein [Promethearchaeota archaeon]|jgi:3-hexulose-6-phosphate synthase/6-phospho-3-hexuloisomerase
MVSQKDQERFHATLVEIADQLKIISDAVDLPNIKRVLELIFQTHRNGNRVFTYGAGRSGFIGRCFAQRLMHLNIDSCYVSDAVTYQYTNKDILFIISGSGETTSPLAIAQKAYEIGGKIVLITSNSQSTIAKLSDYIIEIKAKSKDVALTEKSLAPYTSLFDISALAVLDSIGGTLMQNLGVTENDIDERHASIE